MRGSFVNPEFAYGEAEHEQFEKDGYITFPGFLTPEATNYLREKFDNTCAVLPDDVHRYVVLLSYVLTHLLACQESTTFVETSPHSPLSEPRPSAPARSTNFYTTNFYSPYHIFTHSYTFLSANTTAYGLTYIFILGARARIIGRVNATIARIVGS